MDITPEEQQWLGYRWRYCRDAMRVAVTRRCAPVIVEIVATGKVTDTCWDDFVAAVLADLGASHAARPELYGTALGLFADAAPLRQTLLGSATSLDGTDTVKAGAVLGRAVSRGLTRMRDIRLGGTEHRGKTWGKLDRISRTLAQAQAEETAYDVDRCSMDHFIALLEHLRERHAADHNLPRTIESIEDYFHEFCPDCAPRQMDEQIQDVLMSEDQVMAMPDIGARGYDLELCIAALEAEQRQFVEVKYGMSDPVEISVLSFCTRFGIERTRFGRVLQRALDALRDCLTAKAEDAYPAELGYVSSWQHI